MSAEWWSPLLRWALAPALFIGAAVALDASAGGAGWNQWRGPNRDGKAVGFQAPSRWQKQLTRKWRVEVGTGHSSPLAVGDGVFIFSRRGDDEVIRRLDLATGREVWRNSYPAPYEVNPAAQAHGKGPKSTPAYHGGLLYALGISGILSCLDAKTGKVVWRHEFSRQYKKTSPLYGAAMSPVVDGGLLIAHVGGHDDGALTAFDAKTGAVRWRWAGDGPAYTSPIMVNIAGVRQVVTQTQKMCVGVAAETGRLLWSIPFTTPYDQNAVTPVAVGGMLIFGGTRQPTFACRVSKSGAEWTTEKVWETRDVTMYMSAPVVSNSRLYGMSERRGGQMFSLDAATGKTEWTGDARFGENAAILDGGAVLLVLTTDAQLRALHKDSAALTEVARYQVADSPTWAAPAVIGNRILVKDATTLALWELPK